MAGINEVIMLAIPVGLGVGYFADCFGYCTGFKAAIDDFLGSILGDTGGGDTGGGDVGGGDTGGGDTGGGTGGGSTGGGTGGGSTGGGGSTVTGKPFVACGTGKYRDAATNTCKAIPKCKTGQGWNQATGVCEPLKYDKVDCGTAATNTGYKCCVCKVAAGRTKCPAGVCCKQCISACPSQCKGFSGYGSASFYSTNTPVYRGSYGSSRVRQSMVPAVTVRNRPQLRLGRVSGLGDNDRI